MVTTQSPQKITCKLPNVEGKLNFNCNDTSNKPITNFLNRFVNVYKSLEDTKMLIAEKHLALAVQMYYKNKTFQRSP